MDAYRDWWNQAQHDLKSADLTLHKETAYVSAFLSQQSVEKGLKALDQKRNNELVKTHDLVLLARRVGVPDSLVEHCKRLSPVYTFTRYPDDINPKEYFTSARAGALLESAREVMKWIEKQL